MAESPNPNFTYSRKKLKESFLEQAGIDYGPWLEAVLGDKLPSPGAADLLETLRGGDILCKVLNKITQADPVKFKPPTTMFFAVENVKMFLKGCSKVGLKEQVNFPFSFPGIEVSFGFG